jgi:hypothetical protein
MMILASRLIVSGFASFLAIVLWSRTRDPAWMLIVVGTVASYADILFSLLSETGVIDTAALSPGGIPVAGILFSNLPFIFFGIAFLVMIVRKRSR